MKYVEMIKKVVKELKEINAPFNKGDVVTPEDIEKWGMESPEDIVLEGEEAIKEYIRVRAYEAGAWIFG